MAFTSAKLSMSTVGIVTQIRSASCFFENSTCVYCDSASSLGSSVFCYKIEINCIDEMAGARKKILMRTFVCISGSHI